MRANQAASAKSALFVDMVRAALLVSHQSQQCDAYTLRSLIMEMGRLQELCERIPPELSASDAAYEYIMSQWDEFEGFRNEPDYVHPEWTGKMSPKELRALGKASEAETESLVDGVWQVMDPVWEGLPGDDSNTLKLLAHIRDHGSASMASMMKVLPHLSRRAIHRRLKASEAQDGLIRMVGKGSTVTWEAKPELIDSRPAHLPKPNPFATQPPTKQQRELDPDGTLDAFVTAGKPFRPVSHFTQKVDALKVLAFVRKRHTVSNAEIQKAVPQLDRYRIGRLLRRFQDEGLVRMHGEKAGAAWSATDKLLKDQQPQGQIEPSEAAQQRKRKLEPLEKKVLSLIRRKGQVTNAGVRKLAPHLAPHNVRHLLQRMRDEGLIFVEGKTAAAVWRLLQDQLPPSPV